MTRITQGNFALLPDLTDEQIRMQLITAMKKGFAISIEYTDDPHPRNCYWEMWGLPLFDMTSSAVILRELNQCRQAYPNCYVKINAFNNERGVESTAMSFIVQRPAFEPGFYLSRQETKGRNIRYTLNSYAVNYSPEGERYA